MFRIRVFAVAVAIALATVTSIAAGMFSGQPVSTSTYRGISPVPHGREHVGHRRARGAGEGPSEHVLRRLLNRRV